jgi:L-rhamnose isomerase
LTDELQAIMQEIVRGGYLERVHIGLDFFDASINRIAAWTIGGRSSLRALLMALLEPTEQLKTLEQKDDYTGRLVMLEELKGLPFGAVWDQYCLEQDVPVGMAYLDEIRSYESTTLAQRG